jgi:hypothetical protein
LKSGKGSKKEDLERIIKEASKGNREAFEKLYQEYKPTIRGYIASHYFPCGSRGIGDIEQETWIEVRGRISTYDPRKGCFSKSEFTQGQLQQLMSKGIVKEYIKDKRFVSWTVSSKDELKSELSKVGISDSGDILVIWGKTQWTMFYKFVRIWADIMVKRNICKRSREVPIATLKGHLAQEGSEETDEETIDRISLHTRIIPHREYLEKCEIFIKITFFQGGPPHQLVIFGFNKLLSGWGPKDIVRELSSLSLKDLSEKLILDYKEESYLPDYVIEDCFKPLKDKMGKRVEEVLEDRDSKDNYIKILKIRVGESILRSYYSKNPEHNISDWSNKVRKRVLRLIKKPIKPREMRG